MLQSPCSFHNICPAVLRQSSVKFITKQIYLSWKHWLFVLGIFSLLNMHELNRYTFDGRTHTNTHSRVALHFFFDKNKMHLIYMCRRQLRHDNEVCKIRKTHLFVMTNSGNKTRHTHIHYTSRTECILYGANYMLNRSLIIISTPNAQTLSFDNFNRQTD